jgi:cytochrome c-type biogenesis protein CcmH/NrfF
MKKLTILLGLTVILFSQTALAQVDADELRALREQVRILTQRLDELEKANQQTNQNVAQAEATTTAQVNEAVEEKVDKAVTEQVD